MAFIRHNKAEAEKKANSFGAIADGEYELVVLEAEWRPMLDKPDKAPYFNLKLGIRADVEQEHQGRNVFHSFFISRDEEKVEQSMDFIHRFNFALGVPDGADFETEEQWVNYVIGRAIKGKIATETEEYQGKTRENTKIKYFSITEFPDVAKVDKPSSGIKPAKKQENYTKIQDDDPFSNDGGTIDIDDDDLPF